MKKDKFLNRLLIPIFDPTGQTVGFTGRVFPFEDNSNRPKYLNSPDSDIFKKGELLYGYHLAIKQIRLKKWLIIVEGNMDLIASHKYNLTNIVATQGTSVTTKQLQLLTRTGVKDIVVAFDNDKAGIISGQKLMISLIWGGFEVYKLKIPTEYKDLDEYLPTLSQDVDLNSVELQSLPIQDYLDYEMDRIKPDLVSNNTLESRKSIKSYLELLSKLPELYQEQYLLKLSNFTKISLLTLTNNLKTLTKNQSYSKFEENSNEENTPAFLNTVQNNHIPLFQSLISLYYKQKLDPQIKDKIYHAYFLMHALHSSFFPELDLLEYINRCQDELDIIYENKIQNKVDEFQIKYWFNSFIIYLNTNYEIFIHDPKLKQFFLM
jgi:DNA primase